MTNMNRVVNTQSYGQNNIDATDDINGDVPEVEEANNIHKTNGDHENHHHTHLDVAEEDECYHNYS